MADETKTNDLATSGSSGETPSDQSTTVTKGVVKDTVLNIVPQLQRDVQDSKLEIEQIKVRSEAEKSEKSLYFSFAVYLIFLFAHVIFFAFGKPLVLPELVNQLTIAMVAGGFIGHGAGRIINAVGEKLEKRP